MRKEIDGGLRPIFRSKLKFHWQSLESHSTGKGTPDSNYCSQGVEGWIEFKKCEGNKVASLKGEQVGWIETRIRHGGIVWLAIRQRKLLANAPMADRLWLIRGPRVRLLYEGGLSACNAFRGDTWGWDGGPGAWDWAEIGRILVPRPKVS